MVWQRFSEKARNAIFNSQEEALQVGECYVSTEHLLLGLIREECLGAGILLKLGIPLDQVRRTVERQLPKGAPLPVQDMKLTPRGKRVLDLSYKESEAHGHDYIGTHHILLGLLREADGLAGRVLKKLGVTHEAALEAFRAMRADQPEDVMPYTAVRARPRPSFISELSQILQQGIYTHDLVCLILLQSPPPALAEALRQLGVHRKELSLAVERELTHPTSAGGNEPLRLLSDDSTNMMAVFRQAALHPATALHRAFVGLGVRKEVLSATMDDFATPGQ